jgi:Fe-S-cluster containining protein
MEIMKNDDVYAGAFFEKTGLRFQCRRCSGCCRFAPGYVFLSHEDVAALFKATGLAFPELFNAFLRIVPIGRFSRLSLKEKTNYDCIFWENGGCRIYDDRPMQCRSFPFWSSILSSPETWAEQKKTCPGIDDGPLHSPEEISAWLARRVTERLIEVDSDDLAELEAAHRRFRNDRPEE